MVVQHNLTAMNSNRMLGLTTASQAKSTERLSSGYKINRAADDAAGLSISEKMRKQIRGLTQASANAQDGISAVQTAEGALGEVQDMLQRMNELAVKASNGTNSKQDREYIQNEVDALLEEIDRVSETTKFNETYLLKGDDTKAKTAVPLTASIEYKDKIGKAGSEINVGGFSAAASLGAGVASTKITFVSIDSATGTYKVTTVTLNAGQNLMDTAAKDFVKIGSDGKITFADGVSAYKGISSTYTSGEIFNSGATQNFGTFIASQTPMTATSLQAIVTVTTAGLTDSSGNFVTNDKLGDYFTDGVYNGGLYYATSTGTSKEVGADALEDFVTVSTQGGGEKNAKLTLSLHVGADGTNDNKIDVDIDAMSTAGLGIKGLKVDGKDSSKASAAIKTISDAIQKVSDQRSALGAAQNRLEHTINNLDNVVENTTSAESAIRDTDMATEMVKYSNNNILAQAGQSMLAQANQSNQGVLSLLG